MSVRVKEVVNRRNNSFIFTRKQITSAVLAVVEVGYDSAVVFVGRNKTKLPVGKIKVTRSGELDKRESSSTQFKLTIGRLNYTENKYAKKFLRVKGRAPRLIFQFKGAPKSDVWKRIA